MDNWQICEFIIQKLLSRSLLVHGTFHPVNISQEGALKLNYRKERNFIIRENFILLDRAEQRTRKETRSFHEGGMVKRGPK